MKAKNAISNSYLFLSILKKSKYLFLLVFLSVFIPACGGGGSGGDGTTTCTGQEVDPIVLTIGTPLDETIGPEAAKFYIFDVVDPATYTISLYNMTTDNDWILIEYVSNCEDDYPDPPTLIAESNNIGTADDILAVPLTLGSYLLIVNEFENLPSSYTVSVTR